MAQFLLVGCGGFLGSVGRFFLGSFISKYLPSTIPFPTLLINLLGSLVIGFVFIFISKTHSNWFYFFIPGLIGGFTTFSAFSLEAISLLEKQLYLPAFIYISASVVGGIILCCLGMFSAKAFIAYTA